MSIGPSCRGVTVIRLILILNVVFVPILLSPQLRLFGASLTTRMSHSDVFSLQNESFDALKHQNSIKLKLLDASLGPETTVNVTYIRRPFGGGGPVLEEFRFQYPRILKLQEPRFIPGTTHRDEFYRYRPPTDDLWDLSEEARLGLVTVVENGVYDRRDDCGSRSDYGKHIPSNKSRPAQFRYQETIVALDDVYSSHFQHFMDSAMPKLMQAKIYLDRHPNATLMAHFASAPPRSTIRRLLDRFGIANPLKAWPPKQHAITADELALICKAPPVHPALWERARELLGIQRRHVGDKIIWVTRNPQNSAHGRLALNEEQVQAYLSNRFNDSFVVFDSNKLSLDETIRLFQQARVVLGIHGGGMYNGLFAPAAAAMVEFMPTDAKGSAQGASDKIFWRISAILQQEYWRVNAAAVDPTSAGAVNGTSIHVNLIQLAYILDHIESHL